MPIAIASIDDYIAALPEASRSVANELRQLIAQCAPHAIEDIKYGMPTIKMDGQPLIYFGIWKHHIGLYPIYRGTDAFEQKIAAYRQQKDTVNFKLSAPLPKELVTLIVRSQLARIA